MGRKARARAQEKTRPRQQNAVERWSNRAHEEEMQRRFEEAMRESAKKMTIQPQETQENPPDLGVVTNDVIKAQDVFGRQ